ncbi:hypothetical protein DPMN_068144 [Dreissena polymorpha]|uniref:Uncharacterized protein n=1 Tax=Dreissena polymorpha TaxID=45954 RepID=A0A9D3Z0J8_DREPO|nr:hypothetical protein DPMN_068144 [Dreissena polymorpha]
MGRFVLMNPNQVLTVKTKSKYNVNISSDTNKTCFIKGICSLPNGHFIVVDNDNKKIKLFDKQYKLFSQCDMSGRLCDICQISSSDRYMQFISVRNRQLITRRKFQLAHDAVGIAHHH